jgi:hypothetical protein
MILPTLLPSFDFLRGKSTHLGEVILLKEAQIVILGGNKAIKPELSPAL